jgi:spermidine synthase
VLGPILFALFFLSGAAGLIYELVWVRQLTLVFGGTTYAITTVLVAFMAGLGLGSFLAGRSCHRLRHTARAYGLLEISIGCYALLVPLLLGIGEPAYRAAYPLAAASPWLLTAVRFLISAVILVIPATCMGATLPILVRHVTLLGRGTGRSVGFLYGINALGAVLGVLLAGFLLLPELGLKNTTRLAAAANIGIGLTAIFLLGRSASTSPVEGTRVRQMAETGAGPRPLSSTARRIVLIGFAISGFSAMVYQITWTRALILSLGSSTYSFTCILAAFILGLALGSLAVTRFVDRWGRLVYRFGLLELGIGLSAIGIVPMNRRIPYAVVSLVQKHQDSFYGLLSLQFLLVIAVTVIPTLLMGAIFPLVIRMLARATGEAGEATGRAYAVNTIGTIAGSFLAGFVLIRSDVLGVQNSIILASLLNGAIGLILVLMDRPSPARSYTRRLALPVAAFIAIPVLAFSFGRWDPRVITSAPFFGRPRYEETIQAGSIDYFAEGVDMTVGVYHSKKDPDRFTLTVNGKPDASTGIEDMTTQLLLGHLPALFGPPGKSACIIGLGSGMTLAAVARYPSYERLDCVEISEEVIRAAALFSPYTYNILTDDPRVHLIRADGRNHLLLTDRKYDLIVCEPSNPWISGVASLFTREFFSLCESRLADDGLLAVWLQGYSTSVEDFRLVLRTILGLSDDVSLWALYSSDYMLMMHKGTRTPTLGQFLDRYQQPSVRTDLYRVGLHRPSHLLGRYIASGARLREWVGPGPKHTDDNARLEFSAPRNLYAGEFGLTQALYPLQRPVLDDLFDRTPDADLPRGIDGEIAVVVAGRWSPIRVDQLAREGKPLIALRFLLDAYRADPTNTDLYNYLVPIKEQLTEKPASFAGNPEKLLLAERLKGLEAPVTIPRRGASSTDISEALRKWAKQSGAVERWNAASELLAQAHRIAPADRGIALDLIEALVRSGETARADSLLADLLPNEGDRARVDRIREEIAGTKRPTGSRP